MTRLRKARRNIRLGHSQLQNPSSRHLSVRIVAVDSAGGAVISENEDEMERLIGKQCFLALGGGRWICLIAVGGGGSSDAQRQDGPKAGSDARGQAVEKTASTVDATFTFEQLRRGDLMD